MGPLTTCSVSPLLLFRKHQQLMQKHPSDCSGSPQILSPLASPSFGRPIPLPTELTGISRPRKTPSWSVGSTVNPSKGSCFVSPCLPIQHWVDHLGNAASVDHFPFAQNSYTSPSDRCGSETMHDKECTEQTTVKARKSPYTCSCLPAALAVLAKLHQCVQSRDTNSFDNTLSVGRTGFQVCVESSRCDSCWSSIMPTICAAILQQVGTCYDILAMKKATTLPDMSLKLGSMEFHGLSSPEVMSLILGIEKKQGATVCRGLERLTQPVPERQVGAVWGSDPLLGLLGIFRRRFLAPMDGSLC
jgi:hypothetical protein